MLRSCPTETKYWIATVVGVWALGPFLAHASTICVNTNLGTGNDNGGCWADAYRSTDGGRTALQRALDHAEEGDHIWVATGTYKPDECFRASASS